MRYDTSRDKITKIARVKSSRAFCREAAMSAIREMGFGGDVGTSTGFNQGVAVSGRGSGSGGGGGGQAVKKSPAEGQSQRRSGSATVTMRHLMMVAVRAAVARP